MSKYENNNDLTMQAEFSALKETLLQIWSDQSVFRAAGFSVVLEMAMRALEDAQFLDPLQEEVIKTFFQTMGSEWVRRSAGRNDITHTAGTRPSVGMQQNALNTGMNQMFGMRF